MPVLLYLNQWVVNVQISIFSNKEQTCKTMKAIQKILYGKLGRNYNKYMQGLNILHASI